MSDRNVTYQVERIEGDRVYVRETYDLTKRTGPGILVRAGRVVDCQAEGICSASRVRVLNKQQAVALGLPLLPAQLRETIERLDEALTSSSPLPR